MPPDSASADAPLVLQDIRDGIATLTLNRGPQRNALSIDLMTALTGAIRALGDDENVRVIILAASGPAFCAGHDLKELQANKSEDFYRRTFNICGELMLSIMQISKPVIAQVHGIATAAGCQLVATCDLAVAAADARFATPGVNIGLFCSTPMVALSRNVPRKQTMEMLLTGDMISADRARELGLVNRVVAPDALAEETRALALSIAAKSPLTLAIGKEAFYRQLEQGVSDAYDYTGEVMTRNMMAADAAEGIGAFLGKRKPEWTGK